MSVDSTEYRVYTTKNGSVNHPCFDWELDSAFPSTESKVKPPSKTKSAGPISRSDGLSACESQKAKSFISDPAKSKPIVPLTEQILAIHNRSTTPLSTFEYPYNSIVEQSLLDKVDERCKNMTQEFDEKITKLEAQFAKAEMDINQTRCDIEELNAMEKEYMNQGIQTELGSKDIQNGEKWKQKAEELQDFVNHTRNIVWDTSFIPLDGLCRQLPTKVDHEDDKDICDYHREKIEALGKKSEKERQVYFNDDKATLQRISNWSKSLQHH